jgi:hypothetical protein
MGNYPTKNIQAIRKKRMRMSDDDYMGLAGARMGSQIAEHDGWTYVFSSIGLSGVMEIHAISSTGKREYRGTYYIDDRRLVFSGWKRIV